MSIRICPHTGKACTNLVGCNHIDQCNKPMTMQQFKAANPDLYKDLEHKVKSGELSAS